MKKLLIVLFVTCFCRTIVFAENIRDLQIEGMSVGDSLLNFYTEAKILNFPKTTYDNGVFNVLFKKSNNGVYSELGFHVKINDKKYIIHSIKGMKKFKNKFQQCMKFKDEVIKDISIVLPSANFNHFVSDYQNKNMKNSKAHVSSYYFPSKKGIVRVWCTQYDKNTSFTDVGAVSIGSEDYVKFFSK